MAHLFLRMLIRYLIVEKAIGKIVEFVANNVGAFYDGIYKLLGKIANRLPTLIRTITKALPKVIKDISNAIVKNAPELIKGATECVLAIVESLPDILDALVEAAPTILTTVIDSLLANFPTLLDGLIKVAGKIVEKIPEIISSIIEEIPNIVEKLFGEDGFLSSDNLEKVVQGAIDIVEYLVTETPRIIAALIAKIPDIINAILNNFLGIKVDLKELFGEAAEIVGRVLGGIGDAAKEVFGIIVQAFSDPEGALERALDGMKNLFVNAFQAIQDIIQGAIDLYDDWVNRQRSEALGEKIEKRWQEEIEAGNVLVTPDGKRFFKYQKDEYDAYMADYYQGSKDFFGNRGTGQKNRTTYTATYDQYGRAVESNQPQEVNVKLGGNATVTVEGNSVNGETFKAINKATVKQVQEDNRWLSFGE